MPVEPTLKGLDRQAIERRLLELGLAGQVANTREANLRAIRSMLDGTVFYTFGIEAVARALARGMLDERAVVALMARANGHATPEGFLGDWGEIKPAAAFDGLVAAARMFHRVLKAGGTFAFGTGHPGSMISCYNQLAEYVRQHGGRVARGRVESPVGVDWYLDYVGDVAVTSDFCGILHGHSTRPMEQVIATSGEPIDLVFGDHGHAGAAINAGVATIGIMDTNDPALEVAKHLEVEDLVVVPLYDNKANAITLELAPIFLRMVEAVESGPVVREARLGGLVFDRDR